MILPAQAVAARSFACTEMAFWRGRRHYDVIAGQASQAYVGTTTNPSAARGVRETRGVVLLWRNTVVPAYYSSCCGGSSASAIEAISAHPMNDIDPLMARPAFACCREAPVWRWTSEQSVAEASRRLIAWERSRGGGARTRAVEAFLDRARAKADIQGFETAAQANVVRV